MYEYIGHARTSSMPNQWAALQSSEVLLTCVQRKRVMVKEHMVGFWGRKGRWQERLRKSWWPRSGIYGTEVWVKG